MPRIRSQAAREPHELKLVVATTVADEHRRTAPTAEGSERENATVLARQFSPRLEPWIRAYEAVGRRTDYLWRWVRVAFEDVTLSCVAPEWFDELCDTKVLGVVLNVLLDDAADDEQNPVLLEQLLGLMSYEPTPGIAEISEEHRPWAEFAHDVWRAVDAAVRRFPCYGVFGELLRYDFHQLFNTMRYSSLINHHLELLNLTEHDLYLPHNMHMMIAGTMDLMCSPAFDLTELGRMREVLWHAQCMGHIGNLITTWQRELKEHDFSSGVYAHAVDTGDVSVSDLTRRHPRWIEHRIRAGNHEAYFLDKWREHRQTIVARGRLIKSVEIDRLVDGLDRLLRLELASRGLK